MPPYDNFLYTYFYNDFLSSTSTTVWKSDQGRISEFELYFSFISNFYRERMTIEVLTPGKDWMNSAVCNANEMKCCREHNVLLKGCHDHRIKRYTEGADAGDMCCDL